jgi:hypothetical protein
LGFREGYLRHQVAGRRPNLPETAVAAGSIFFSRRLFCSRGGVVGFVRVSTGLLDGRNGLFTYHGFVTITTSSNIISREDR